MVLVFRNKRLTGIIVFNNLFNQSISRLGCILHIFFAELYIWKFLWRLIRTVILANWYLRASHLQWEFHRTYTCSGIIIHCEYCKHELYNSRWISQKLFWCRWYSSLAGLFEASGISVGKSFRKTKKELDRLQRYNCQQFVAGKNYFSGDWRTL